MDRQPVNGWGRKAAFILCVIGLIQPAGATLVPLKLNGQSTTDTDVYNYLINGSFAASITNLPLTAIAPIPPNTVLSNNSATATQAPIANASLSSAIPVQGFDTPLKEGAIGNGSNDDTTYIQTCANTLRCYLAPPTTCYKTTSTINMPAGAGVLLGAGNSSVICASAVSGAVIAAGGTTSNANIGNFKITGTATTGIALNLAYDSKVHDIYETATFSQYGFAFDQSSFCMNLDHLISDSSTIGVTLTLSGAGTGGGVGTVATGTITATNYYASAGPNSGASTSALPNGAYMAVFTNGEVRRVTISGTTISWTGNLASTTLAGGNITTASIGSGVYFGSGSNCIVANMIETNNATYVPFGFILEDIVNYGLSSSGSVFNSITAENCQVCFFLGAVTQNVTFNSLYCENCVLPLLVGEAAGGYFSSGVFIDGANLSGPVAAAPGYANRYAFIDVQAAYGFDIRAPQLTIYDGTNWNAYPLTVTGGTQVTAPVIYGYANAAGVMKLCAVVYPGDYSVAPTTISPASGSATFTLTTGMTPFGYLGVTGCAVSAGGTGYTADPAMVPIIVNTNTGSSRSIVLEDPPGLWGISGSANISSILARDSINPGAFARTGLTILGDTGYYDGNTGANLFGASVNHGTESQYREWVQYIYNGVPGAYIVPLPLWP